MNRVLGVMEITVVRCERHCFFFFFKCTFEMKTKVYGGGVCFKILQERKKGYKAMWQRSC